MQQCARSATPIARCDRLNGRCTVQQMNQQRNKGKEGEHSLVGRGESELSGKLERTTEIGSRFVSVTSGSEDPIFPAEMTLFAAPSQLLEHAITVPNSFNQGPKSTEPDADRRDMTAIGRVSRPGFIVDSPSIRPKPFDPAQESVRCPKKDVKPCSTHHWRICHRYLGRVSCILAGGLPTSPTARSFDSQTVPRSDETAKRSTDVIFVGSGF